MNSKIVVGSRVRVIEIPSSVDYMPSHLANGPDGTRTVFQRLIRLKRCYKVLELEPDGSVWIETSYGIKGRPKRHHKIRVERDCIELC